MFDQSIPIFKKDEIDQEKLDALKEQYQQYDEAYVTSACYEERRLVLDEAYGNCKPYLDSGFVAEISKPGKFMDRLWELVLCSILLHKGYVLEKWSKTNKPRPDVCVLIDGKKVWVEAVCPDLGNTDPVEAPPALTPGIMYSAVKSIADDLRPRALRITSVLDKKLAKREDYVRGGLMKETDPYIVAINTHRINHFADAHMIEELALFGMGLHRINIKTNEASRQWVPEIKKLSKDGEISIPVAYFLKDKHGPISAAIFYGKWFEFEPNWKDALANGVTTYFNEMASVPLEKSSINFGERKYTETITDENDTKIILRNLE